MRLDMLGAHISLVLMCQIVTRSWNDHSVRRLKIAFALWHCCSKEHNLKALWNECLGHPKGHTFYGDQCPIFTAPISALVVLITYRLLTQEC